MAWEVWLTLIGAAVLIAVSPGAGAIQSMATGLTGLVFFLAVLPQFVVPTTPLLPQYLAIGATMVAVDLVVMGLYTALAVRLLRWMHTPRQQTVVNRTLSGLFATAAVVLSLVRRAATA